MKLAVAILVAGLLFQGTALAHQPDKTKKKAAKRICYSMQAVKKFASVAALQPGFSWVCLLNEP